MLLVSVSSLHKKYNVNVDENETLKTKVTDNEEYTCLAELLEEKKQAEEKYLKEKQITAG